MKTKLAMLLLLALAVHPALLLAEEKAPAPAAQAAKGADTLDAGALDEGTALEDDALPADEDLALDEDLGAADEKAPAAPATPAAAADEKK